jgi:hypothetical protein
VFKGSFIYKKQDYSEALMIEAKELIDYLGSKGVMTPILKENGLLVPRNDDEAINTIGNYTPKPGYEELSPRKMYR